MSHKGNFNVTDMGRIALSLQELVERQAAEIAKLKEEQVVDRKLLKQFRNTNGQLRAKIEKQGIILEKQNQVITESNQLFNRTWLGRLLKGK